MRQAPPEPPLVLGAARRMLGAGYSLRGAQRLVVLAEFCRLRENVIWAFFSFLWTEPKTHTPIFKPLRFLASCSGTEQVPIASLCCPAALSDTFYQGFIAISH